MATGNAKQVGRLKAGACAVLLSCLPPVAATAQVSAYPAAPAIGEEAVQSQHAAFTPFPLLPEQTVGLAFDTAGSEERKLRFELAEPLSLEMLTGSRWLNAGGGSLLAGTSLEWTATGNLNLGSSVQYGTSQVQFQSLGSIHCQNGILQAGSYRASDCYFIDDSNDLNLGIISVGANYEFGNNALAAINVFKQEATFGSGHARLPGVPLASPALDAGLISPAQQHPLFPLQNGPRGLEYLESEVTGIDLQFNLGVSTDTAGDMQLGLQFTHVLSGSYEGMYAPDNRSDWTLAKPFDTARVSFDWRKNTFSGGVQGFYREPVNFLNRSELDGITTFDVYFTWRAPWNASLSVGASNVLNSGVDEAGASENKISDPFEAVYGRIPYVRYQQDL